MRHEIPFKTKRVEYTERNLLEQSKNASHTFFLHCARSENRAQVTSRASLGKSIVSIEV